MPPTFWTFGLVAMLTFPLAFPGVVILLTVLALNLIGEGLNDALNPRLSRER